MKSSKRVLLILSVLFLTAPSFPHSGYCEGQLSLTVSPATLVATFNTPFNQTVTMAATGGSGPYTYYCGVWGGSDISASVDQQGPTTGSAKCTLSGMPTAPNYIVHLDAVDSNNSVSEVQIPITIGPSSDPLDNWHLRLSVSDLDLGFADAAYGNGTFVSVGKKFSSSPDTKVWTVSTSGAPSNAIVFGGGIFVAVGDNGSIVTSTDGMNWTTRRSGSSANLISITFGNGQFVALGFGGVIFTSPDGAGWTQTAILHQPSRAISYGGGIFVAVRDNGAISTSPDAITWTIRNSGTAENLLAIAFGNGLFVATGTGGAIVSSPDGVNWTAKTVGTDNLGKIIYGNGIFVTEAHEPAFAGYNSRFMTSPDGLNWTASDAQGAAADVLAFGNDLFLASTFVGYHGGSSIGIATSSDGKQWRSGHLLSYYYSYTSSPTSIAFGNNLFVSVGDINRGRITLISKDGVQWGVVPTDDDRPLVQVIYGNGVFVAVGYGAISSSTNGVDWISTTSAVSNNFSGAAYGDGIFVAVGDKGIILSSSDGITWTSRASGTVNALSAIIYANGTFIAVGDKGTIVTSTDGITWTLGTSGTLNPLLAATYGDGTFVAVGALGEIVTSQDGVNWRHVDSGVLDSLSAIAYGNGRFVAIGSLQPGNEEGISLMSGDAITWIKTSLPLPCGAISFGDGFFVAVGGGVISTTDGISWKVRVSPDVSPKGSGITFANGSFVIVGDAIYQSGSFETVPVYRFYNPGISNHFYTASEEERSALVQNPQYGWNFEGAVFYTYGYPAPSTVPVYRFAGALEHYYTTSEDEKDLLIQNPQWGWIFENVAFYAYAAQAASTVPVYRFYNAAVSQHYYSIDEAEKNLFIQNPQWGWNFEGIVFYVYPSKQ